MLSHQNVPRYQVSVQSVMRVEEHHPSANIPHLGEGLTLIVYLHVHVLHQLHNVNDFLKGYNELIKIIPWVEIMTHCNLRSEHTI